MVSLLVLLAVSALLLASYLVRRRRFGFRAIAARRGLRYETSAESLPPDILSGLSLSQGNWETSVCHLVHGRYSDFDVYMFEFSAKSGPQMNDPETTQTVVTVRMEGLPGFLPNPSPDAAPYEGSRQTDARLDEARSLYSLDRWRRTSKWKVEGNGQWVAFWQPSRMASPEEAGAFLDEVLEMARNLSRRKSEVSL